MFLSSCSQGTFCKECYASLLSIEQVRHSKYITQSVCEQRPVTLEIMIVTLSHTSTKPSKHFLFQFKRNLNLWGFRAISKELGWSIYFHEYFQEGRPEYCHSMTRSGIYPPSDSVMRTQSKMVDNEPKVTVPPRSTHSSTSLFRTSNLTTTIDSTRTSTTDSHLLNLLRENTSSPPHTNNSFLPPAPDNVLRDGMITSSRPQHPTNNGLSQHQCIGPPSSLKGESLLHLGSNPCRHPRIGGDLIREQPVPTTLSCQGDLLLASELELLIDIFKVRRIQDDNQRLQRLLSNDRMHRLRLLSTRHAVANPF